MLKNQKGITLVALVVTIVILIILATISISVVINSGLINDAKEGSSKYKTEANTEHDVLANVTAAVEEIKNAK